MLQNYKIEYIYLNNHVMIIVPWHAGEMFVVIEHNNYSKPSWKIIYYDDVLFSDTNMHSNKLTLTLQMKSKYKSKSKF